MPSPSPATPASSASLPSPTAADASNLTSRPTQGLSRGATIGISIGAAFGATALVLAIYAISKRLHRRKQHAHQEEDTADIGVPDLVGGQRLGQDEKQGVKAREDVLRELPSPVPDLADKGARRSGREVYTLSELPSPVAELEGGDEWMDRGGK